MATGGEDGAGFGDAAWWRNRRQVCVTEQALVIRRRLGPPRRIPWADVVRLAWLDGHRLEIELRRGRVRLDRRVERLDELAAEIGERRAATSLGQVLRARLRPLGEMAADPAGVRQTMPGLEPDAFSFTEAEIWVLPLLGCVGPLAKLVGAVIPDRCHGSYHLATTSEVLSLETPHGTRRIRWDEIVSLCVSPAGAVLEHRDGAGVTLPRWAGFARLFRELDAPMAFAAAAPLVSDASISRLDGESHDSAERGLSESEP